MIQGLKFPKCYGTFADSLVQTADHKTNIVYAFETIEDEIKQNLLHSSIRLYFLQQLSMHFVPEYG